MPYTEEPRYYLSQSHMSMHDIQEARRLISLVEMQKNKILEEIMDSTNSSWVKKGKGVVGGMFRQCAYLFGATLVTTGCAFVFDKSNIGYLGKLMLSFLGSYLTLFITFEYLLPDSSAIVQRAMLVDLVRILNDYQLSLEKFIVKN